MAATSEPSEPPDGIQPATGKKPKVTFLTLPQELRDHIYSFIPLVHENDICISNWPRFSIQDEIKPAVMLARTCHTIHKDMIQAFWAKSEFYFWVHYSETTIDFPWSAETLSWITKFELAVDCCFKVEDWECTAYFQLVKEIDKWHVRLLPYTRVHSNFGQKSVEGETEAEKDVRLRREEAVNQEKMRATAQRYMNAAQQKLRRDGHITFGVLEVLRSFRVRQASHRRTWR